MAEIPEPAAATEAESSPSAEAAVSQVIASPHPGDRLAHPARQARLWRVFSLLLLSCCLLLAGLLMRDKRMHMEDVRVLEARVTRAAAQEAGQQALREQLALAMERERQLYLLLELVTSKQTHAWVLRSGLEDVRVFVEPTRMRGVLLMPKQPDVVPGPLRLVGLDATGQPTSLGLVQPGGLPLLFSLSQLPDKLVLVAEAPTAGREASGEAGTAVASHAALGEAVRVAEFSPEQP